MTAHEIAVKIVNEDMGARAQTKLIKAQWDGCGLLDDFAAEVSQEVAALIGIEQ